jgi:crossover junction endodeoxyribonuclease RusA
MILPFPPTLNGLYAGKGRRYKSDRYKAWIKAAREALWLQSVPEWVNGPLRVELAFVRPDKRKRDLDNVAKAVLDFCTDNKIWDDDSQIEHLTLKWVKEDFKGCRIVITKLS